jgi:hypothetical protein
LKTWRRFVLTSLNSRIGKNFFSTICAEHPINESVRSNSIGSRRSPSDFGQERRLDEIVNDDPYIHKHGYRIEVVIDGLPPLRKDGQVSEEIHNLLMERLTPYLIKNVMPPGAYHAFDMVLFSLAGLTGSN